MGASLHPARHRAEPVRHTHTGSPGASPSSLPRCHGDIGLHLAKQAHVPQAWAHPPLLQLISHCEEDLLRTLLYQDSGTSSALPGLAPNSSVTPKVWERCSTETRAISLPPLPPVTVLCPPVSSLSQDLAITAPHSWPQDGYLQVSGLARSSCGPRRSAGLQKHSQS